MYVNRSTRVACVVSLLVCAGFLVGAFFCFRDGSEGGIVGGVMLSIFATVFFLLGLPYLLYVFSDASKSRYQRDVMAEDLEFDPVSEKKGLQFAALVLPDEISVPSHGVVAVFVQNAHSRVRRVKVYVHGKAFSFGRRSASAVVGGGEVRLITLPFVAGATEGRGERVEKFDISVEAPSGVGMRVIQREGKAPRGIGAGGRIVIAQVVGEHEGGIAAPHLANLALDTALFSPKMAAPDLTVVNQLLKTAESPPSPPAPL